MTIIYANCQAEGLALFLTRMGFKDEIRVYRNYQFINKKADPADLLRNARTADLFIYQEINPAHGLVSSDAVLELLPDHAITVAFCPGHNHGFFPLIPRSPLDMHFWSWKRKNLLDAYDEGWLDWRFETRFLDCLAEQARREASCDIRMVDWIMDHRHRLPFLTVGHPTTQYFMELAKRTMKALNLPILAAQKPLQGGRNAAKLPCTLPVHPAVIKHFKSDLPPNPKAKQFYRDLLIMHYNKENP